MILASKNPKQNVETVTKTIRMRLSEIQPSQLYISREKLSQVMKTSDPSELDSLKPIPVKKLGNRVILVDGHTRAFAAFLKGLQAVTVYWEEDELDWEEYEICVQWCREEGIRTIADLQERVIAHDEYKRLWLGRCRKMQNDLEAERQGTHS